jgi:glycosyltransferase involved in cell wall biosynthesis
MSDKPICAVWVVTYNQKTFIAQTLESILSQKTNFPFRIYLGDDFSNDGTREICIKYKNDFPELIELILNSSNHMQQNSANVYSACFTSGAKYTAMCEGDDYWTDCHKLQTQVDFLETNSKYIGCFHNTEERYEDDPNKASFLYCSYSQTCEVSFRDLTFGNYIPTCSVMFRNNLFGAFPEWYPQLRIGDWVLHLLNAQFGDFWYMPKIMGVHRLHSKSTWMLQDAGLNREYTITTYNTMISGFEKRPDLQQQLVTARDLFINPPIIRRLSLARRGVNYVKRLITH